MLEKNELIAEVQVPAQGKKAAYFKVTTGSADDWPALGVAAVLEGDGGAVKSARVVFERSHRRRRRGSKARKR